MSDIEYKLFDPKEDFIFKMIFGTEENKSILISLLNSILKGRPYNKDVTLGNNEISKIFKDSKSSRLDILATSDDGIKFNIEMQCRKTKDIKSRTLFYASKLFTKDLKENEDYKNNRGKYQKEYEEYLQNLNNKNPEELKEIAKCCICCGNCCCRLNNNNKKSDTKNKKIKNNDMKKGTNEIN